MEKVDMSCARVKQYQSSDIGSAERHNERKNDSYENINVVPERIPLNVHYRDTGSQSYMEMLRALENDGKVSLRGLRQDATLFDEIVIDVNTMYFERNGGYDYAKKFYEEAVRFLEKKFGAEYVISAVMHADEINKAATEDLGKPVYHYHLHAVVLPVVEKEILWSKRCKDSALRGTVKEVVHQISHSKKWASDIPMTDENGEVILRKNGKPKYRPSYSILQDELFEHMTEHGFKGFQRGELGSTAEHLSSIQYQMKQDKARLAEIQSKVKAEELKYEPAHDVYLNAVEVKEIGKKTLTGKITMSADDHEKLVALATEGITSRGEIHRLKDSVSYYSDRYYRASERLNRMEQLYYDLREKCQPFLDAMEHFPQLVKAFVDKVKELFTIKEAQERQEREARKAARYNRNKPHRSREDEAR